MNHWDLRSCSHAAVRKFIKEYVREIDQEIKPERFTGKIFTDGCYTAFGDNRGLYAHGNIFTPPPRGEIYTKFKQYFGQKHRWYFDAIISIVKNHPENQKFTVGCGGRYESRKELGEQYHTRSVHSQQWTNFYYDRKNGIFAVMTKCGDAATFSRGKKLSAKRIWEKIYPYPSQNLEFSGLTNSYRTRKKKWVVSEEDFTHNRHPGRYINTG